MPCPKGGSHHYDWKELPQGWRLVCDKCGHVADYQPVPSHGDLITQNKRMADQLSQIDEVLESDKKPAIKVAECLLIRNEDKILKT